GSGLIGDACTAATDCAAGNGAPACFDEWNSTVPGGLCTQSCVLGNPTCPPGTYCTEIAGLGDDLVHGYCLPRCISTTSCTSGTYCRGIFEPDAGLNVCRRLCDTGESLFG